MTVRTVFNDFGQKLMNSFFLEFSQHSFDKVGDMWTNLDWL